MRARLAAHHADGLLVRLAVQLELFAVQLALAVHLDRLGGGRIGTQAIQTVHLGHQILHQVVFGERPLVEHLKGRIEKKMVSTRSEYGYLLIW